MHNPRIGALLLALGYLGVAGGTVAQVVPYSARWEQVFFEAALAVGFGIAGYACWRWTTISRNAPSQPADRNGPTRLMALACCVLALGFGVATYQTYKVHSQLFGMTHGGVFDPNYAWRLAGG